MDEEIMMNSLFSQIADSNSEKENQMVSGKVITGTTMAALNTSGYQVRELDGCYLLSNPSIGALSLLTMIEMLAFERLEKGMDLSDIAHPFEIMAKDAATARTQAQRLLTRLVDDGWARRSLPVVEQKPFDSTYLTVTRACNLACPYCYQGHKERAGKTMPLAQVERLLDDVMRVNESAHIVVTGGEPMMHSDFQAILDAIALRGLTLSILTNGVLLDDAMADRLARQPGLERVQISIDGITEEIHAISRGRKTFLKTKQAVERVAEHNVPFLLNPTIHEDNAHEIIPLALWALSLGGSISANDLRHVPNNEYANLALSAETFNRVRRELSAVISNAYRQDSDVAARITRLNVRPCSVVPHNARFNCGVARSVIDIDWNGDVYPCHMIKGNDVKLGNMFIHSATDILDRGVKDGWRTPSHKIEGCSSCSFVSTCSGGCRSKTYFAFGTPKHPSPTCEDNGRRVVEELMNRRGFTYG
jgi:radical SAM protein with 4Fe4S-binding SPASM domain